MTLDAIIMGLGALLALLPFLGVPSSWHTPILVVVGLMIVALGIVVRRRGGPLSLTSTHTFVESTPRAESAEIPESHGTEEA